MKCTAFAVLALLAVASMADARTLQSTSYTAPAPQPSWWSSLLHKFYSAPAPAPAPAPKPSTSPVVVFVPSSCPEGLVLLKAIFMQARPAIAKVIKNGGVPVMDSAIANALIGNANGNSAATATNLVGPAKAVSDAVAQAIWGNAQAAAAAKSKSVVGNTKAISSALANALGGIAQATSTANGQTIFGMGATISSAQADAVCAPAWADSTSNCATQTGGCTAVSSAIALAFKGDANAKSYVTAACATLSMRGQPCSATGSAQALSVGGTATATSASAALNKQPVWTEAILTKLENKVQAKSTGA